MKKILLGSALISTGLFAIASPAFGQVQADLDHYIVDCSGTGGDGDLILTCAEPSIHAETIVVTGDRIGYSRADDLTAPVSILTEDQIQARNQGVIGDLLRTVPGLSVSQSGGGGALTQIRLRGSEANHIRVIIDGVEVANPSDGGFDFGGLRNEDIVKIEILRGEQSALYGSDAIGGVINIITRAGSTQESWRASIEGGSRDTLEGQISAVIPIADAALSINGNGFTTDGFDVAGLSGERDGAESTAINIGLNNIELGGLNLGAKFGRSVRETEFDSDSDFDGRLNNTDDISEVTTTTARLDGRFDVLGIENKISFSHAETDTDTVGGFSTRSIGTRDNIHWAAKKSFNNTHNFTLLGEYESESYEIRPNFTEDGAEPDNETYAIAGDYKFSQNRLDLSASARHDFNDLFDDATTWRLGAGYGFEWDGRLRGSVGTGVKNPSLIELFGFFPTSNFTGNPDLEPETSLGFSVGYDQSFGGLQFSVDYFYSELSNEITTLFNPDFTTTAVNLESDSTRSGIEIAAKWAPIDAVLLSGSVSFLDSEQDDIEEIRRPDFLASATATWEPIDALALTLSADHNGEQLDTDFATFSDVTLDSFTLIGANVRYSLNDNVAITLRGSNLLDEDYQEVVGFASPGRAVFGGLELEF